MPCNHHSPSYRHPRFHKCSISGYTFAQHLSRAALLQLVEHIPNGPSTQGLISIARSTSLIILAGLFGKETDLHSGTEKHVPLHLRRRAPGQAPQTEPLHLAASVDGGCIHGVRDAQVARGHPDLLRHQRSRECARPHCSAPTSSSPRTSLCACRRRGPGLALSSLRCGQTASAAQRPCARSLRA